MPLIYTPPREIPVRFVRTRDQVAWIMNLDAAAGVLTATQVRAAQSASGLDVAWLEVLDMPTLADGGEPGSFVLLMAERHADGRHGPVLEVTADEAQCLVIRERVAVSTADAYEPGDVIGAAPGMCGVWVDAGPCALGEGHPAHMTHAPRGAILTALAWEGHPLFAGGITQAPTTPAITAGEK